MRKVYPVQPMKTFSRRRFIQNSIQVAATAPLFLSGTNPLRAAAAPTDQMTIDLTPGAIGVNTSRPIELNALAAKHGFTSVAPQLQGMESMSDSQLGEMVAQMKRQGLKWGTAGCPVSIRSSEDDYRTQLSQLPKFSNILAKVGGTRMNTYIPPSSRDTTYLQNFKVWSKRLREISEILADNGQRIGLEYIGTHT